MKLHYLLALMLLTIPKKKKKKPFHWKELFWILIFTAQRVRHDLAIEHVHNTHMVDMFYYVCFPFILTFCHSTFIPSGFKFKLFWYLVLTVFRIGKKKKDTSLRFRDPNGNLIMYHSNVKYYCKGFCLNSACDFLPSLMSINCFC